MRILDFSCQARLRPDVDPPVSTPSDALVRRVAEDHAHLVLFALLAGRLAEDALFRCHSPTDLGPEFDVFHSDRDELFALMRIPAETEDLIVVTSDEERERE